MAFQPLTFEASVSTSSTTGALDELVPRYLLRDGRHFLKIRAQQKSALRTVCYWRAVKDSNLRMLESKSSALTSLANGL
jgi:hypothetical protein